MIKVLVVDDHELVRTGIKHMLSQVQGIKVIGEANSGEQAIAAVKSLNPDMVLMDVKMPGIGGLEATRKLMAADPELRVLVITSCDDDVFPLKLLQAGASGYLTKGASLDEMVQAIRAVSVGQRHISSAIAQQLALRHLTATEETPFSQLSEREFQVAAMIADGKCAQDIADSLHLSPKTINSYRYRVFQKLGVKNDVGITLMAARHGVSASKDKQSVDE